MATITSTELGASGRYIDLGTPAALTNLGDFTVLAYVRPSGAPENALGYIFGKGGTSGFGPRFYNQGTQNLGCGSYSNSNGPNRASAATQYTYGTWVHQAATFGGTINYSDISNYVGVGVDLALTTGVDALAVNGSVALVNDSALKMVLMNREGLARAFIGDIAYIAVWNRVLTLSELITAQNDGPLNVSTGLVLLWANQQDLSPNALAPTIRSTYVAGALPPNTNLGGALPAVDLTGAAQAVASASGTLYNTTGLSGAAVGDAVASGSLDVTGIPSPAIFSPTEGGTLKLSSCSVAPNGLTPQITLANRWVGEANTNGWRSMHGAVSGVLSMTPTFRLSKTQIDTSLVVTKNLVMSYDQVTWFSAANLSSDASYIYFSHSSAFTGNTVFFALQKPWLVTDTLPWIQSLEASGFISEPPSSLGNGYVAGTRSASLNELGEAIAACPLYSFKISAGAGAAPDGQPKRKAILIASVHASEDTGTYVLKGAVDFLLSADAKAVAVRSWFDFYVYPVISAAGRRGGAGRGDFQAGYITSDANRVWGATTHQTAVIHKAAWVTDCGNNVPVHIDYHSFFTDVAPHTFVHLGADKTTWTSALAVYRPGVISTDMNNLTNTSKWAFDNLSSEFAISPEFPSYSNTHSADPAAWGADTIRALSDIAVSGYWQIVSLAGDSHTLAAAQGALSVAVPLAAAGLSVATATGAMSVSIPLGGSAQSVAAASGTLSTSVGLAGAATATANATGGMSLSIPLSGPAIAQAMAQAGLSQGVTLAGSAAAVSDSSGDISLNVSLSGAALAAAASGADLSSVNASSMSGAAYATSSAAGGITQSIPLSGASVVVSDASGALSQIVPITGSAASAASVTGGLDVTISLGASALAYALASADLTSAGGLSGAASGAATATGTISLHINMDGAAIAEAIASGVLTAAGLLVDHTPGWVIAANARDWRISA